MPSLSATGAGAAAPLHVQGRPCLQPHRLPGPHVQERRVRRDFCQRTPPWSSSTRTREKGQSKEGQAGSGQSRQGKRESEEGRTSTSRGCRGYWAAARHDARGRADARQWQAVRRKRRVWPLSARQYAAGDSSAWRPWQRALGRPAEARQRADGMRPRGRRTAEPCESVSDQMMLVRHKRRRY
jgi:hypothetical protein